MREFLHSIFLWLANKTAPSMKNTVTKTTRQKRPTVNVERLKQLYAAGASVGKISRTMGISYMGTRLALKRCGIFVQGKNSGPTYAQTPR
jgi:hypothetical protein